MTTPSNEPQVPLEPPAAPMAPPGGYPPASYPPAGYPPASYPPAPQYYGQQPYPQNPYGQQPAYGQPGYPVPQYGYPGYQLAAAEPLSGTARVIGCVLAGFGALVAAGAFLPWLVFGSVGGYGFPGSVNGIGNAAFGTKDGVITLPLGLIVIGFGLTRALVSKRGGIHLAVGIVTLIAGLLIIVIGLADIGNISSVADTMPPGADGQLHSGGGLILTVVAGLGVAATAVVAIIKRT